MPGQGHTRQDRTKRPVRFEADATSAGSSANALSCGATLPSNPRVRKSRAVEELQERASGDPHAKLGAHCQTLPDRVDNICLRFRVCVALAHTDWYGTRLRGLEPLVGCGGSLPYGRG